MKITILERFFVPLETDKMINLMTTLEFTQCKDDIRGASNAFYRLTKAIDGQIEKLNEMKVYWTTKAPMQSPILVREIDLKVGKLEAMKARYHNMHIMCDETLPEITNLSDWEKTLK